MNEPTYRSDDVKTTWVSFGDTHEVDARDFSVHINGGLPDPLAIPWDKHTWGVLAAAAATAMFGLQRCEYHFERVASDEKPSICVRCDFVRYEFSPWVNRGSQPIFGGEPGPSIGLIGDEPWIVVYAATNEVVIALPATPAELGRWGMTAIHLTGALDDLLRVAADRAWHN